MPLAPTRRARLPVNVVGTTASAPLEGFPLVAYAGSPLTLEVALYRGTKLADVSGLASILAEVLPVNDDGLIYAARSANVVNPGLTIAQWAANLSQHAAIHFSADDLRLPIGPGPVRKVGDQAPFTLRLSALNSAGGEAYILGYAVLTLTETGVPPNTAPVAGQPPSALTRAQGDALYAAIGSMGGIQFNHPDTGVPYTIVMVKDSGGDLIFRPEPVPAT